MKEFKKFDEVREISSHNYLALEHFINDLSVAYTQCKLASDFESNYCSTVETNELIFRGLCDIEGQLKNIQTWYNCISKGIDMDI